MTIIAADCEFCGTPFTYERLTNRGGIRVSCDSCRTQKARSDRYKARFPERERARKNRWNAANRERVCDQAKRSYYKNHERSLLAAARYREQNKERIAGYMKDYRAARPPAVIASELRRRARHANAPGRASVKQIVMRFAYYGNCCAYCGGPAESVDHVIPLSRGGSHWPANLRPACSRCNSSKHNKLLSEWAGSRNRHLAAA